MGLGTNMVVPNPHKRRDRGTQEKVGRMPRDAEAEAGVLRQQPRDTEACGKRQGKTDPPTHFRGSMTLLTP